MNANYVNCYSIDHNMPLKKRSILWEWPIWWCSKPWYKQFPMWWLCQVQRICVILQFNNNTKFFLSLYFKASANILTNIQSILLWKFSWGTFADKADKARERTLDKCGHCLTKAEGGSEKFWHWLTKRGGGVRTPPFLVDIIYQQSLSNGWLVS